MTICNWASDELTRLLSIMFRLLDDHRKSHDALSNALIFGTHPVQFLNNSSPAYRWRDRPPAVGRTLPSSLTQGERRQAD